MTPLNRALALATIAACSVFCFSAIAPAHPPTTLSVGAEKAVAEEILAFRKELAAAIAAKDVAKLRVLYHANFTHTHTSGKTDNRDARIVTALAGDPIVETAETLEIDVRVPNDWTAVIVGTSPIRAMTDGKVYAVKWMQVLTRADKSWVIVASQATRGHEITK